MTITKEITVGQSANLLRKRLAAARSGERQVQNGGKAWWHTLFYGCAACVGGGAGHIGCLIAPLVSLGADGSLCGGHSLAPMIGTAAATNTVILGVWYHLRGRYVSMPIKVATVGFALAGMVVTTAFNLRQEELTRHKATEEWIASQTPQLQREIRRDAAFQGISEVQYAESLCVGGQLLKKQVAYPTPNP